MWCCGDVFDVLLWALYLCCVVALLLFCCVVLFCIVSVVVVSDGLVNTFSNSYAIVSACLSV